MNRHMTRAGATVLLLVAALYPGAAAAHEGADLEVDPCVRWVGESAVHFNAYQPQYELKAQYCTDIPKTGETFLVVDLVDPALRNVPIGMRIVKGNGSNEAEAQTVADWRPSHHPDGVVSGETTSGRGPVQGDHYGGGTKSLALSVSLAGTDDRLSEADAFRGSTADRRAAPGRARVQARTIEVATELVGGPPFVGNQEFRPAITWFIISEGGG